MKVTVKGIFFLLLALPTEPAGGFRFRGGRGGRGGGGHGQGGGSVTDNTVTTPTTSDPKDTIRQLMRNRHTIERHVAPIEEGVFTETTSDNEQVASWIKQHVEDMKQLMADGGTMREWDPLFAAVFRHADDITLNCTDTNNGVECTHFSDDKCGAELVKAHAKVVSAFIDNGPEEVWAEHEAPCDK